MHTTHILDFAFGLIEVRMRDWPETAYRGVQPRGTPEAVVAEAGDILERRARGEECSRKRRNAEAMSDKLKMVWEVRWGGTGK